jgi:hypothetical protein
MTAKGVTRSDEGKRVNLTSNKCRDSLGAHRQAARPMVVGGASRTGRRQGSRTAVCSQSNASDGESTASGRKDKSWAYWCREQAVR